MRVFQLLSAMGMGGVTDYDAVALARVLRDMGLSCGIYAEHLSKGLENTAKSLDKLPKLQPDDVLIYHKSPDSVLSVPLENFSCRKLMIFHGITPPRYFKSYSKTFYDLAEQSMQELCRLADKVDYCMVDSACNAQILRELNYHCPITVRPLLIPFSDYAQKPSSSILTQYEGDGMTNFLFVGRISPNKKQEDVLRAFYCYQKYCNPNSRLFLVGSHSGMENYYSQLQKYAAALELRNVVFTGGVAYPDLIAYYRLADLFLCMSEREGFCMPLVEAMYFGVPILARKDGAVPDTLGESGLLLPTNDPMEAAFAADRVLRNPNLRREITAGQRKQQQKFAYAEVRRLFEHQFQDFLDLMPSGERKKRLAFRRT